MSDGLAAPRLLVGLDLIEIERVEHALARHPVRFRERCFTAREIEELDRRRYAGPVGWVDADGNGAWAVGGRSAEFDGVTVRVYAGNGIVADSDPATEFAETQAKFAAVLGALVRP